MLRTVTTRRLAAPVKLERDDLGKIFRRLSEAGWTPAAFESKRTFLKLAGLDANQDLDRAASVFWLPEASVAGDVFFRDRDVYYCMVSAGRAGSTVLTGSAYFTTSSSTEPSEAPDLELGLITDQPDGSEERLTGFAEAFRNAVLFSLDGRRTRHMNFDWAQPAQGPGRLARLQTPKEGDATVRFQTAHLDSDAIEGAITLSTSSARELLQTLSRARFARERDIVSGGAKRPEDIKLSLEDLKRAKLVRVEYLLECRKSGALLTRLSDSLVLKSAEVGSLLCPSCSAPFHSELVSEGYSLSELGQNLVQSSRWMTVWLTNKLVELGVPIDSILWNLTEGPEEVDVVVEFLGNLWILELKDREFGAGDAYPFNYRRSRYNPEKAFVVTTDKVSPDAKRVLEEFHADSKDLYRRLYGASKTSGESGLVLIEGLEQAEEILSTEIPLAGIRHADRRLSLLDGSTGFDLTMILAPRFGYRVGA